MRTAVVWDALRAVLAELAGATGRDVLDIVDAGGGTGGFAVPLAALGHTVTVVDPSPDSLAALERRNEIFTLAVLTAPKLFKFVTEQKGRKQEQTRLSHLTQARYQFRNPSIQVLP